MDREAKIEVRRALKHWRHAIHAATVIDEATKHNRLAAVDRALAEIEGTAEAEPVTGDHGIEAEDPM